ncbi:MAG: O-methyltransferase [Pseudonocardiaceae bacterium]
MQHRQDIIFTKPSIFIPGIAEYIEALSSAYPEELTRLREETLRACPRWAGIMSSTVQASFLNMLVTVSGAGRVLEIGTFTGYSALAMAAAMPADGKLITIDNYIVDEKAREVALTAFVLSPHGGKIQQLEGVAIDVLSNLNDSFDLIFLDADKPSYIAYFNHILEHGLLAGNGLLVVDNTLWGGRVMDARKEHITFEDAPADEWVEKMLTSWAVHVAEFNSCVTADERVDSVVLPIHDGMTLIRHTTNAARSR